MTEEEKIRRQIYEEENEEDEKYGRKRITT